MNDNNKVRALHDEIRRANKEHSCMWCGNKICKGETYHYMALVNGPKAYSWKAHERCERLAELAMNEMNKNSLDRVEFSDWVFRFPFTHRQMTTGKIRYMWDQTEFPEMIDIIWKAVKK